MSSDPTSDDTKKMVKRSKITNEKVDKIENVKPVRKKVTEVKKTDIKKKPRVRVKELPNHWGAHNNMDTSTLKKWLRVMQEREGLYVNAAVRYAQEKALLDSRYRSVDDALESVRKASDDTKKAADIKYQQAVLSLA